MKLRSKNTEKWRNKIHEENPFDGIQKSGLFHGHGVSCAIGRLIQINIQKKNNIHLSGG